MIPKDYSFKSHEEEKKGGETIKSNKKTKVYKKTAIVFRAQKNKEFINMDNLNPKNNDYFEIKKQLSTLGYKPLDCMTDQKNQDLYSI